MDRPVSVLDVSGSPADDQQLRRPAGGLPVACVEEVPSLAAAAGQGVSGRHMPVLGSPAFAGRERELAKAAQALARPPAFILVEGEAGIGKTRLVEELLKEPAAGPGRVLVAACPPFRQPHTLGPVADAVRQAACPVADLRLSALAGALRPLFPEWSADLPPSPEPAEDPTAARHRVFRALLELFHALGVGILVLEDAHWADDATAEFVLFLVAQRPPRISVLLTWRPGDLGEDALLRSLSARQPPGFTQARVHLGPLTVQETVLMVSSMVHGEPLSAAFAEFLHEGTDGVPLAVEESVRLMYDRDDLVRRADGWARRHMGAIVIPPTVRDAVLERASRLDRHAQAILRAVAVLAEGTDTATVAVVSGLPPDAAANGLDAALGSGLIAEQGPGMVSFHHALAGRAVYDAMPPGQRRSLHLRAGRALERQSPQPVARLARHFREAGQKPGWCRYAEQTADQALAAGDDAAAVAMLYELVTGAEQPPGMLLRLVGKFPSMVAIGQDRLQNLVRALRSALRSGGASPDEAGQLRVQLGRILTSMHQYTAGRAELATAVRHPGLDAVDRARAMILLGWASEPSQPAWVHRRWLRGAGEALAAIEPARRQPLDLDRAAGLLLLGEDEGWAAAAALDEAVLDLLPSQRVAHDLNIGDLATMWGRLDEARRRLTQALHGAEQRQYRKLQGTALVNLARLDWFCGAWSGLRERASELAGTEDLPADARVEARYVLAQLQAATGGKARAQQGLASVLAASREWGALPLVADSAAALARLLLRDGDAAEAVAVTDEPAGTLIRKGVWVWATDLGPARVAALLAAGRDADAGSLTTRFARGLRGRDAPAPRASLLVCQALLAESRNSPGRAAAMFEAAAAAWAALPRPYDALLARESRGRCLLAAGQSTRGLAELAEAAGGMAALGARRDADRVRQTLRDHGVEVRPSGGRGRPSYGRHFSPREWQVADLVAEGKTNRQIAEALHLSQHTVVMHVKSAMRKAGVSSRTALVMRVAELHDGRSLNTPA